MKAQLFCSREIGGVRCRRPRREHVGDRCPYLEGGTFHHRSLGKTRVPLEKRIGPGSVFGRWTVVRLVDHVSVVCKCACGTEKAVFLTHLFRGLSKGCVHCAPAERGGRLHIESERGTRSSYRSMIDRCHNPNLNSYKWYGARGVTVCDEWRASFDAFLADVGLRPEGTTLDRIDGTRGYEPGNCRWATPVEQLKNRSNTVFIEAFGERLSASEVAVRTGFSLGVIYQRIRLGWTPEQILSVPLGESRAQSDVGGAP